MTAEAFDTEELLTRAAAGDAEARQQLLARHRERLLKMVDVRMDRRLLARVDASDIVQEALIEAANKLSGYLKNRTVAFYPWLKRLAWEHLIKMHQRHIGARKRSAKREENLALSDESVVKLARCLAASETSPSRNRMVRDELRARVRAGLAQLASCDREVLVMRYLEQLSMSEIAAVLETSEAAVKMRHTRALRKLSTLLGSDPRNV